MRKKTTEIIIVTILWIFVIASMIYNPNFRIQTFFGIISLTFVSAALILKKGDLSLGVLSFALILSTFNAIKFGDAFDAAIGVIHLFPLMLLLVLIFSRFGEVMTLKEKWFGDEPKEAKKAKENRIALYKREFQNLSSEELNRKANDEKLVEEARIAANQILKKET